MNLSELKKDTKAKIKKILDKKGVQIKLSSLGISTNTEIMMIKNEFVGPVILAVGENRIMLGRGLADKIEIELV